MHHDLLDWLVENTATSNTGTCTTICIFYLVCSNNFYEELVIQYTVTVNQGGGDRGKRCKERCTTIMLKVLGSVSYLVYAQMEAFINSLFISSSPVFQINCIAQSPEDLEYIYFVISLQKISFSS